MATDLFLANQSVRMTPPSRGARQMGSAAMYCCQQVSGHCRKYQSRLLRIPCYSIVSPNLQMLFRRHHEQAQRQVLGGSSNQWVLRTRQTRELLFPATALP